MKHRIKPVDGLRTFAAFGVVWIHVWSFFGNPSLKFAAIDFYQAIAIVGNGVDFFFVISGFCMYLMTAGKQFDITGYCNFLYKRFLRIAPAFYLSVFVYAILIEVQNPPFDFWYNVIFHLLFLNNVVTGNTISGPFWSIGTEWHFYMVLPALVYLASRLTMPRSVIIFSACSIAFIFLMNLRYVSANWWDPQIIVRFPEFAIGIIACYYFLREKKLPAFFSGFKGLAIGLVIMYIGRGLKFAPLLAQAGKMAFLLKSFADIIMTASFGILLYHVITERSLLSKMLSSALFTYLGRISYSIYLWHSLAIITLAPFLSRLSLGVLNPLAGFLCVAIVTVFISHFSYKYLEAFYFRRSENLKAAAYPAGHKLKQG